MRGAELFVAVQQELGDGTRFLGADPVAVHLGLREAMLPRFPWLERLPPRRISRAERAVDLLRLAGFVVLVLLGLSLPGLALALLVPTWVALGLMVVAALAAGWVLWLQDRPGKKAGQAAQLEKRRGMPSLQSLGVAAVVVAALVTYVVLLSVAGGACLALLDGWQFGAAFLACAALFALGVIGIPATVLTLLLWLRRLERRDPSQEAPPLDEEALDEMVRREDQDGYVQNHMGSVVLVKPGALRAVLVRIGLRGLGLVLRVTATDGYLGSMRTIHFAHWALVSNGSRLMFFSNFDGSWESYLDDFIEKAHGGLTLAWGGGVGFPPARYLVLGGASQGRQFKALGTAFHGREPVLVQRLRGADR